MTTISIIEAKEYSIKNNKNNSSTNVIYALLYHQTTFQQVTFNYVSHGSNLQAYPLGM